MSDTPSHYTRTAITLHWVIALLIFVVFPVGLYMADLPLSPQKLQIYSYHKWAGITILVLAAVRLLWRLRHRPPALPDASVGWESKAAAGAHHLLYLLMLAVPLAGWLSSSAKGFQTVWFGILPLPDLVPKNEQLADILHEAHELTAWAMALVILAHAAAALKHHFIAKDDVLARMLPFLKK